MLLDQALGHDPVFQPGMGHEAAQMASPGQVGSNAVTSSTLPLGSRQ